LYLPALSNLQAINQTDKLIAASLSTAWARTINSFYYLAKNKKKLERSRQADKFLANICNQA